MEESSDTQIAIGSVVALKHDPGQCFMTVQQLWTNSTGAQFVECVWFDAIDREFKEQAFALETLTKA